MTTWKVWVIGTAMMCRSISGIACSVDDITIREARWHMEGSYIQLVGEFINGCVDPTGVELEATFRNKANQLVIVDKFWPASISDIPPKTEFRFSILERPYEPVETMELRVHSVRRWGKDQ